MTQWDTDHDRSITQEEMFLNDIAVEEIEWIKNLQDSQVASLMDMPIILDHPNTLAILYPKLPANTDADIVQTFFSGQAMVSTQVLEDDHCNPIVQPTLHANNGKRVTRPSPKVPTTGASLELQSWGCNLNETHSVDLWQDGLMMTWGNRSTS